MKKLEELEKQKCSTAVVTGLARNFFPTDGEMLHLLGLLQTTKSDRFEVALKAVCEYGEARWSGFAELVARYITAAIREIEEARKLTSVR